MELNQERGRWKAESKTELCASNGDGEDFEDREAVKQPHHRNLQVCQCRHMWYKCT